MNPTIHPKEDSLVQQFMANRDINLECSYQKLVEEIIAYFERGGHTTSGDTLDLTYFITQIKQQTERMVTPKYVNPTTTNGLTILPPTIAEIEPRCDELKKRSQAFYNMMKSSVGDIFLLPAEDNIPTGDTTNMRNILKDLHCKRDVPKRMAIYQCYLIGKVLLNLKNILGVGKVRKLLEYVKEDVGYSKSYSYFLIDFCKLCMEFPKVKTVSVPIRAVKVYLSYIKTEVSKESTFWK